MLRARFLHLITCHVPSPGIVPTTSGMLSGHANHYTTAAFMHSWIGVIRLKINNLIPASVVSSPSLHSSSPICTGCNVDGYSRYGHARKGNGKVSCVGLCNCC